MQVPFEADRSELVATDRLRRLIGVLAFAAALMFPAAARAQAVPDVIRSASLTQSQANELNRRLASLRGRFGALAQEMALREGAVRNIAVEIFGAQPNLDFETYVRLIESGARELHTYITDARARRYVDPVLGALRQRAIAAAGQGHLTEARALYDQLITRSTEILQARRAREDRERQSERNAQSLAVAADIAESGRLAHVAADYFDAARRLGEAADRAPETARHERWQYRLWQADALSERGLRFGEPEPLREAVRIYTDQALPLAPRAVAPADWATTQNYLGNALLLLGERGDETALREAIVAYRAALEVRTRTTAKADWAQTQSNLGVALSVLGERGDEAALRQAIVAHRAALEVRTRANAPDRWAQTQNNLGAALQVLGVRGDEAALREAIVAYRAALEVYTRAADPADWALTQNNLGSALKLLGERGDEAALREAIVAYRAALEVSTRAAAPADWAMTQNNLGSALKVLGERGDDGALREAIVAFRAALEVRTRTAAPADWAQTLNNLGNALQVLGERGDEAALREAIGGYRAALDVRTRAAAPMQWAIIQFSLGRAYGVYVLRGDLSKRGAALEAMRAGLSVFEQVGDKYSAQKARQRIAELEALK